MNPIRQVAKMLALMPVVALAAACGNSASTGGSTTLPSVVDSSNPFRAGYPRTTGVVNVTAIAPNGVRNTIRVDLGGESDFAAPQGNEACRRIDGVNLRTVPGSGLQVQVQAVYSYTRPMANACTVAPRWTASRSGLTAEGFQASIARTTSERTTITATAPNGVSHSLTF